MDWAKAGIKDGRLLVQLKRLQKYSSQRPSNYTMTVGEMIENTFAMHDLQLKTILRMIINLVPDSGINGEPLQRLIADTYDNGVGHQVLVGWVLYFVTLDPKDNMYDLFGVIGIK